MLPGYFRLKCTSEILLNERSRFNRVWRLTRSRHTSEATKNLMRRNSEQVQNAWGAPSLCISYLFEKLILLRFLNASMDAQCSLGRPTPQQQNQWDFNLSCLRFGCTPCANRLLLAKYKIEQTLGILNTRMDAHNTLAHPLSKIWPGHRANISYKSHTLSAAAQA